MQAVRKIGVRFAALLAMTGVWFASPAPAQEAADQFRLVAATSSAKLNSKSERKDRGVVVYVMRGWLDVFSTGMDDLAAKMKARGINAIPMSHSDHLAVAAEIIARHKKGIKERPVLIGHSLGANATVSMATELGKAGIHVPLIVMFDPTAEQLAVPSNVGRAVNFFQSNNGWGVKVGRGTGFRGKLENIDLHKEELGHTGIDKSARLHTQSISFVQGLRGVRDRDDDAPAPRPKPKPVETAGEPKVTPASVTGETKTPASASASKTDTTSEAKTDAKPDAKPESKSATSPAATVAVPSTGDAKTAPAAPAATSPKATEKPAEKKTNEKPDNASSTGKPDGLFSDIKRPTL